MEATIRHEGAILATIGIHDGKIIIGLSTNEIERLATMQDVVKVSRRDLAVALTTGCWGATKVAGTMLCASMVGLHFFATGGIGGVHHSAETTMDISADLTELSRTPVLVVCDGAKSILDLDLTLEYLEMQQWDKNTWSGQQFPTRESLDAAAPEHPVALSSKDGHLLWVNSLALQRAGITAQTLEPANGAILRDGSGEPIGILQEETATSLVYRIIEALDPTLTRSLVQYALTQLQRSGITTIHDIEGRDALRLFQQLRDEGALGVRIQMILSRHVLPQLRTLGLRRGFGGLALPTASDVALLISSETIFTAALSWLLLREHFKLLTVAALLLGFFGVWLSILRLIAVGNMHHMAIRQKSYCNPVWACSMHRWIRC